MIDHLRRGNALLLWVHVIAGGMLGCSAIEASRQTSLTVAR
ncbi:MAG: hypothetical protein ACREJ4_03020 [Candidatus Methylomirabilaceae bacterium]